MRKHKIWVLALTLLGIGYIGSYLWLSRRAYEEADRVGMRGFYYFYPENTYA